MIFDIDEEEVVESIATALENAIADVSEEQFMEIAEAIENEMPGVIAVLTHGMADFWKSEAIDTGGWGVKYAPAIQYKIDGNVGEIYLDENLIDKESHKSNMMFVMMMEQGVKSWSIKDALLASEKVKVGKDGIKYITIPFPVATPRKDKSIHMDNKFGKREMTQEIYDIVKSGGKISAGTTINVRGKDIDVGGLTRYNTRQYHSQYGFFRCVSSNSTGWQYPDIPAEPVYPKVLNEVNARIQEVLTEFCQEIVKEYTEK
jgi:hypothetical protein